MSSSKAARIWERTRVGLLLTTALAVVLLLIFLARERRVVLLIGVAVAALAALEVARMGRFASRGHGLPLALSLAVQLFALWGAPAAGWGDPLALLVEVLRPALVAATAFGALRLLARLGRTREASAAAARHPAFGRELALLAAVAAWVVFPLPALAEVWTHVGSRGLVALVLLSKIGDVSGYYVGSAIGRTRPFPRTSPGKTLAGCVASLVAGTAGGAAAVASGLLPEGPLGLAGGLLAGALVNLAAQAGDLLESRAKRWAGVKDSAGWFGPAGGVLDLVDSLLVSVPMALLAWPILFPAG